MFRQLRWALAAVVAAALLITCGGDDKESKQTPAPPPPQTAIGHDLFEAYDIYGTLQRSDKWIGKQPVVVNFWGTWCPPCRREIPDLVKLYNEYYPKGVEILGLAVRDTPTKVSRYAEGAGMRWVMLMADQGLLQAFGTGSVPTTLFYNRHGDQVGRFVGAKTYDEFKPYFDSITAR